MYVCMYMYVDITRTVYIYARRGKGSNREVVIVSVKAQQVRKSVQEVRHLLQLVVRNHLI